MTYSSKQKATKIETSNHRLMLWTDKRLKGPRARPDLFRLHVELLLPAGEQFALLCHLAGGEAAEK